MATDEPRELWDQRNDEKAKPYKAFRQYLEMGVGRSLRKLAERDDRLAGFAMMSTWSRTYAWGERSQAWDMEQSRIELIEQTTKVKEMRRAHAAIGTQMLSLSFKKLQSVDPLKLTVREACLLGELGAKLEKAARGEPDARVDLTYQATALGGPMLTSQDLWQLLSANPHLADATRQLEDALRVTGGEDPRQYGLPASDDDEVVDAELVDDDAE